jgi:hypothetical protein
VLVLLLHDFSFKLPTILHSWWLGNLSVLGQMWRGIAFSLSDLFL